MEFCKIICKQLVFRSFYLQQLSNETLTQVLSKSFYDLPILFLVGYMKNWLVFLLNYVILYFSERFGLYEVDYSVASRPRSPRLSAAYYAQVARTHCLPEGWHYQTQDVKPSYWDQNILFHIVIY